MLNWLKKYLRSKDKVFAYAGEEVTCESGHVICQVARDIKIGARHDYKAFDRWRQLPPKEGDINVTCAVCGGLYWHGFDGQHFHFVDGWRTKAPIGGTKNAASR